MGLHETEAKYGKSSLDQGTADDDRSVPSSDDFSPIQSSGAQPNIDDHENLPEHRVSADSTVAAANGRSLADASAVVAQDQRTGNDDLSGMLFRHMNV